jgi:hypothetical protein
MRGVDVATIDCPYCGERIELSVDCSIDAQEYVEDCSVCCRPMIVIVAAADGALVDVEVRTESE